MAKIKRNNFLTTVNEVFTDAINEGVLHLYSDPQNFSGRTISIDGKSLFHFGTTGYLGLELDERLKAASIEAIQRFGTQFPLSKTYVSNPLYNQLEENLNEMYSNPVVITKNSTLGHLGVIPSAVQDQDAIILDHQVHWSVQNAAKFLKIRSVPLDMIRHNDLDKLEDKVKKLKPHHRKIWYMADGIYSMYGDFAPIKDLEYLCEKYQQLHLYLDDVHGMSWIGKNGTGYVHSEIKELTDQMLVFGTLSKTFGASGAVLVCSNKDLQREIKTFGGPLTFSAQLEPASVAAAIASSKIHLSPEIYSMQEELYGKIQHFNKLINQTSLPLLDQNRSPVFFIGTGMPKTGYNFVNRLMKDGFFVNLGIFPAVPVKNTGVRITISRHNQLPEIEALVEALVHHYPRALKDTNTNMRRVLKAFKIEHTEKAQTKNHEELRVTLTDTISRIPQNMWDKLMRGRGVYDWRGLKFLEEAFQGNSKKEHNWSFKYLIITDNNDKPVLATFLSVALWKDDMLADSKTSEEIEKQRKQDPYFLTSKVLSMGCLFTEGNHLYLDRGHELAEMSLNLMLEKIEQLEKDADVKMVVLRDFNENESLHDHFQGQGFVRMKMPEACDIVLEEGLSIEKYYSDLSARNRRHFRKEILEIEPLLKIEIRNHVNEDELSQIIHLFENVHQFNLGLNTFDFPDKLFTSISSHSGWEFILVYDANIADKIIGVMFCYDNQGITYVPAFVGMDYDYIPDFHIYRQLLYQTIKRAITQKFKRIDLGMTAAFEKRKLGANVHKKFSYVQTADNYKLELIGLLEG